VFSRRYTRRASGGGPVRTLERAHAWRLPIVTKLFASTPFAPSSSPSERALGYRHSPFAGASRHGRVIVGRDDEDGHGWGAVPDGLDDVPTAHLGIVSKADLTQGVKKLNALHVKVNRPSSRVASLQARQGLGHGSA
jgi:hypothetical protein